LNGDTISGGAGDDKILLSSNTGLSGAFTFDSIEALDMNGLTLSVNTTQALDLSSLSLLNGGLIEGNASVNTITGTSGNDTIDGLGGADVLNGAAGNDVIYGGAGGDRISGGQGNDSLYARLDATTDTTTDTVFGFSTRAAASGGDVLDLAGMLQGATGLTLSEYLNVQLSGADTQVNISSGGNFAGGVYSAGAEDQMVTLAGVNLFTLYGVGTNNDQALLGAMAARGNLLVD
jgi:Ca2+-binding RTX toxin-like protein